MPLLCEEMVLGGGAAAPFTPASLSPVAWYDATDITTLFQDVAGTTPVTTDGDPVRRINDKSGNGYHQVSTNPGTYVADGQNGLPIVDIPTTANFGRVGFATVAQPFHIFAALSVRADSPANVQHVSSNGGATFQVYQTGIPRTALQLYCGSSLLKAYTGAFAAMEWLAKGATSNNRIASVDAVGDAGTGGLASDFGIGGNGHQYFGNLFVAPAEVTGDTLTAARAYQADMWGVLA